MMVLRRFLCCIVLGLLIVRDDSRNCERCVFAWSPSSSSSFLRQQHLHHRQLVNSNFCINFIRKHKITNNNNSGKMTTTLCTLGQRSTATATTTTNLFFWKNDEMSLSSTVKEEDASESFDPEKIALPLLGVIVSVAIGVASSLGYTIDDVITGIQLFLSNPQIMISNFIEQVKDMGPIGALYFGMFYLIAETLAVPATPLALSAGYLFGFTKGFAVVLTVATAAACIGFFVGKTYLRSYVEKILEENPKFAKIDRAIGEKGFKLLVLVRLSPIFPFSISNYIYGASSIDFVSYFWGTLLGFTPSTLAYVYTGMVGKDVMFGDGTQPWYVYVGGFGILLTLLKLVTDVATGIIDATDDE